MERLLKMLLLMAAGVLLFAGGAAGEIRLLKGQTWYVPSNTSFIGGGGHVYDTTPTIFIHNTDQNNPINIVRVDFYNTNGTLVEKYLQKPQKLNANAATRIRVKKRLVGEEGSGAHFIIQWQAESKVVEPLLEVWFIGAAGTRGYSLTSHGRVIQEDAN